MSSAAASASGAVAGAAMNSMYDKSCVMCEYILEQVDKMIKAQPRMMNGNGYYPGVMDFGGGVQQGNYRIYQGTYLEEGESSTTLLKKRAEARIMDEPKKSFADTIKCRKKGVGASFGRSAHGAAKQNKAISAAPVASRGRFSERQRQMAMQRFQERMRTGIESKVTIKSLLFTSESSTASKGGSDSKGGVVKKGTEAAVSSKGGKGGKGGSSSTSGKGGNGGLGSVMGAVGGVGKMVVGAAGSVMGSSMNMMGSVQNRVKTGRHTFKDKDLTDDQVEKDQEFTTMYKDFMDAMDDVCFHDLPKDFQGSCKYMYYYGDRVVEMYLHDYDDYEICAKIPSQCIPSWFDE